MQSYDFESGPICLCYAHDTKVQWVKKAPEPPVLTTLNFKILTVHWSDLFKAAVNRTEHTLKSQLHIHDPLSLTGDHANF